MPLDFPTPVTLPGRAVQRLNITLVEIRFPDTMTFWYDRTTDRGVEQQRLPLTLADMQAKYPGEYTRLLTALRTIGYQEARDGGLAPAGGTVS